MNKTELIKQVAQEANLTQKDATASVQAVLEVLVQKMPALCKLKESINEDVLSDDKTNRF
ncbi:hypothetical protein CON59_28240 [Bacillus cereus]|uniref:HU family DNA-binding protein n=1 Tax=Bacillus cereus TaxID=1396 RepID=UPI000BEC774B|nr:HU family DNA-binding protein [Bacillus cereus]PEE32948.1 hypothetical protein CON59_28240 [Bacillus cereus]